MKQFRMSFVLLFLGIAAACSSEKADPKAVGGQKEGTPLVRFNDTFLSVEEVEEKLAQQSSFMQARYRDLGHRRDFVDNLVRFELLAEEARRQGLDQDPEVAEKLKQVLVQELTRRNFDESQAEYSEERLKAYYEEKIRDFVKPERRRVSHIFFAAAEDDAAARASARREAGQVLARLQTNAQRAAPSHPQHGDYDANLFAHLARELSKDVGSQSRGGDLAYLSREDAERRWGEAFAEAVFSLSEPRALGPVVETPRGFHLVTLVNIQHAVNRSFDEPGVKKTLSSRLFREERGKSFDGFVEELRGKAAVSYDEARLEALKIPEGAAPASAPAQRPRPERPADRR